jgi:Fe-S-cluster containining protein
MADRTDEVAGRFLLDLRASVRDMAAGLLGPARDPAGVLNLATNMLRIFELTEQSLAATFPPAEPIACAKGCTYCCHLLVFTDAPTVFLVADTLNRTLAPAAVAALKDRLAAFEADNFGLDTVPRPPCPLLVDSLCQVYAARPLVCRAQNSFHVAQCEEKHVGERKMVEAHDIPLNVWNAVSEGLAEGLREAGFAGDANLEFSKALHIVLDSDRTLERWLGGEPIFAPARWQGPGGAQGLPGTH